MRKNKEIKFRVWDKEENDIVDWEGVRTGTIDIHALFFDKSNDLTIMQFTGHVDGDGKDIYEGDILQWVSTDGSRFLKVVEYDYNQSRFAMYNTHDEKHRECWDITQTMKKDFLNRFKIVGNIYENPDWLNKD